MSNIITDAHTFLAKLEDAVERVVLCVDPSETEVMIFNTWGTIKAESGGQSEAGRYLGSWITSSQKERNFRKGPAWTTAQKLDTIWKSSFSTRLKLMFNNNKCGIGPVLRNRKPVYSQDPGKELR